MADPSRRRSKFNDPEASSTMIEIPYGLRYHDLKKRYGYTHAVRRYVPGGHHDNIVKSGCRIRALTPPRRIEGRMYIDGVQHHPVTRRNVLTGKVGSNDQILPPRCRLGPQLLAPGGHYNEDVIDHRFTPKETRPERITLGYPAFKKEDINDSVLSASQAREEHASYKLRTHAALTEFLYEAKDKAGQSFDKDEFSKEVVRPKGYRPLSAPFYY